MNLGSLLGGLGQLAVPLLQGYTGGQVQGNELRLQLAQQQQQRQQAERLRQMQIALQRAQMEQDAEQFRLTQQTREKESDLNRFYDIVGQYADPSKLYALERSGFENVDAIRGMLEPIAQRQGLQVPQQFQPMFGNVPAPGAVDLRQDQFNQGPTNLTTGRIPRVSEPPQVRTERMKSEAQEAYYRAGVPVREQTAVGKGIENRFAPGILGEKAPNIRAGTGKLIAETKAIGDRVTHAKNVAQESARQFNLQFALASGNADVQNRLRERAQNTADFLAGSLDIFRQAEMGLMQIRGEQMQQIMQRAAQVDPYVEMLMKNIGLTESNFLGDFVNPETAGLMANALDQFAQDTGLGQMIRNFAQTARPNPFRGGVDAQGRPINPGAGSQGNPLTPFTPNLTAPNFNAPAQPTQVVPGGSPVPNLNEDLIRQMEENRARWQSGTFRGPMQRGGTQQAQPKPKPKKGKQPSAQGKQDRYQKAVAAVKDKEYVDLVQEIVSKGKEKEYLNSATPAERNRFNKTKKALTGAVGVMR